MYIEGGNGETIAGGKTRSWALLACCSPPADLVWSGSIPRGEHPQEKVVAAPVMKTELEMSPHHDVAELLDPARLVPNKQY